MPAVLAVLAVAAAAPAAVPATAAQAQPDDCVTIEYQATTWQYDPDHGGFVLIVTINNGCESVISGWTVELTYAPGHEVAQAWNTEASGAGQHFTFTERYWNSLIFPGGATSFGTTGTFTGEFRPPTGCSFNGTPCVVEGEGEAPIVELTLAPGADSPLSPCPTTLVAEASDPDGAIDRVEFYADGALVGTDDTAPYHATVPAQSGTEVFARAYDDASPSRSTDSDPITLMIAVRTPPPPTSLAVVPCVSQLALPASTAQEVTFLLLYGAAEVSFTVSGDPGVTVTPTSVAADGVFTVTVAAAPGTEGATATVTPSVDDPAANLAPLPVSVS